MKTIIKTSLVLILSVIMIQVNAQSKNATSTVIYECNFDCPSCETKVMKNIPYEKGIKGVKVNYEQKTVTVEFKEGKNTKEGVQKALEDLGYTTTIQGDMQTLKVQGNCGMCKDNIEQAALSVTGVTSAKWNGETKELSVNKSDNFNINQVHKAIANIGYDTEKEKGNAEAYSKLPACCQYRDL